MEAVATHTGLTMTAAEVREITGGYKRAADQLKALHARGFFRAYLRDGHVVLERAHYEAVCRGAIEQPRPRVKPPRVGA